MNILSYNANYITAQVVASVDVNGQVQVVQCPIGEDGVDEQFTAADLVAVLEDQQNDI